METRCIAVGEGGMEVRLSVIETEGRGLCAALLGGDEPHVGGVVLGVPQQRLNQEGLTCDISQICLPGHKDVIAGAEVARILAMGTGQPVSVTCGVHKDDASLADIEQLIGNCKQAACLWVSQFGDSGSCDYEEGDLK